MPELSLLGDDGKGICFDLDDPLADIGEPPIDDPNSNVHNLQAPSMLPDVSDDEGGDEGFEGLDLDNTRSGEHGTGIGMGV